MSELEIMGLLKKMQEQLISLERKIDTLANKSQERPPFNRDRSFAKPFQTYGGGAPRHVKGHNDHGPRKEYGPKKDYGPKKTFGQERPFEKRSGSNAHGFNPKKKSFFKKTGFSK